MKPFDLEAAKRGEPITAKLDGDWAECVKFVGIGINDAVIIDTPQYGTLRIRSHENLRMAPKKQTVYVTLFKDGTADWSHEEVLIGREGRKVIAGAIPIEIEV